jgi:glycine cleavage system aminomethyltransferase T
MKVAMNVLDTASIATGELCAPALHEFWAARSQQNDWMHLGGFTLPGILDDWQAETAALAGSAGFADISWRRVFRFSGPELQSALLRVFDGHRLRDAGRWCDVSWHDARGFMRGAGRLAIIGHDQALLCTHASDLAWFFAAASGLGLEVRPLKVQGLRLAGPAQRVALEDLAVNMSEVDISFPGMAPPLWADRREQGFSDLWCHPDQAYALAHVLTRHGLRPVGVRAIEAWRVQAGLARLGADWLPVQEVADLATARRTGELTGPAGSFYLAELPAIAPNSGLTSVTHWPPTGQVFGIGWSLLGHYQETKDGPSARFLRAAATD